MTEREILNWLPVLPMIPPMIAIVLITIIRWK
jgi:hypothetical protein